MVTTLILKTTRSQYGSPFDNDDYVVLDGDHIIGRIFLSPQSPPGRHWMWTITAMDYPPSIHSRGYFSDTRVRNGRFQSAVGRLRVFAYGSRHKASEFRLGPSSDKSCLP
jgi:hypothetical protein